MITVTWFPLAKTPDYLSECKRFIAVYNRTVGGYANYWVFAVRGPRPRVMRNAITVGGLPALLPDWAGKYG